MVYVLNQDGQPIMPTRNHAKVRVLLKNGKAKVIHRCPFTIQLLYPNDMGNSYNDGMYRNNGHSRGSAMEHLQMAMDSARDEQEREAIRQAMSQLNR